MLIALLYISQESFDSKLSNKWCKLGMKLMIQLRDNGFYPYNCNDNIKKKAKPENDGKYVSKTWYKIQQLGSECWRAIQYASIASDIS